MAAAISFDPVNPPGRMGVGWKPAQLLGVLAVKPLFPPFYTSKSSASGGLWGGGGPASTELILAVKKCSYVSVVVCLFATYEWRVRHL